MDNFGMLVRRITSALLTAIGVVLIAVGLLSYTQPVAAAPVSSDRPVASSGTGSLQTLEPLLTPSPGASAAAARVATRVVVPALGIDLPVIRQPGTADS